MAGERTARFKIEAENKAKEGIQSAVRDLLGIDEAAKKVGDTLKSAFTVVAIAETTRRVAEFGAECVNAFADVERSHLRLKAAFDGNITNTERSIELMDQLATRTLEGKDSVEQMVSALASLGKSPQQIDAISRAAVNLANATGKDLNSSWQLLNGTMEGSAGKLSKLLPEVGNMTAAQLKAGGAIDVVNAKLSKISNELADSASQKIHNLGIAFDDLKEGIGQALWYAPYVDGITKIVEEWGKALKAMNDYTAAVAAQTAGKSTASQDVIVAQKGVANAQLKVKNATDMMAQSGQTSTYEGYALEQRANGQNVMSKADWDKYLNPANNGPLADALAELKKANSALADARRRANAAAEADQAKADKANKLLEEMKDKLPPPDVVGKILDSPVFNPEKYGVKMPATTQNGAPDRSGAAIGGGIGGGSMGDSEHGSGGPSASTGKGASLGDLIKSLFSGSKGLDFGSIFQNLFSSGGGFINKLMSAIGPAISGVVEKIATKLGPIWAVIIMIGQAFASVIGPAIDGVLKPLFTAVSNIGKWLGQMFIPLLNILGPQIEILAMIIGEAFAPILQMLAPVLALVGQILAVTVTPILKVVAIAFEVLTSPVRFVGDLLKWFGNQIEIVGYNITKAIDNVVKFKKIDDGFKQFTPFSSDAFTGLEARIAKIWNGYNSPSTDWEKLGSGMYKDIGDNTYDPTPVAGGSSGTGATYTGGRSVTMNFYENAITVGDGGIRALAIEIRKELVALEAMGM
jgi:hypothetical protein